MKKILFFALMLLQIPVKSQTSIPANIDIHKNVMTIINYNKVNTCGIVNSTRRSTRGDEGWEEVMTKLGAYDLGSGFVYEYEGEKYVITCEHAIFRSEEVVGYDALYRPYELELIGGDTFYDIAILKFKNPADAKMWRGVRFDFTPQVDTEVYAAGYYKLDGGVSIGRGKLLCEDKDMMFMDKGVLMTKIGFVESDAPTDSGYSGGVLYNVEGQVIGMNNLAHTKDKTSYAIQSKIIERIIRNILDNDTKVVQRAFIGIQFSQRTSGEVIIDKILDDTPAANCKDEIEEGKPLISIDGEPVDSLFNVLKIMENTPVGETISLKYGHKGTQVKEIQLTTIALNNAHLEAIITHAVQDTKDNEIKDIRVKDEEIIITTDKDIEEVVKTAGLNSECAYHIESLAQLGTLVRIFGLYGELKIGIDKDFKKGRWIRFSKDDEKRVLYY